MVEQETFEWKETAKPLEEDMIQKQKAEVLQTDIGAAGANPEGLPNVNSPPTKAGGPSSGFFGALGATILGSVTTFAQVEPIKGLKLEGAAGTTQDIDELLVKMMMDAGKELDEKYKTGSGTIPAEVRYGGAMAGLMMIKGRLAGIQKRIAEMRANRQQAGAGQPMQPSEASPDTGLNLKENQVDPNAKG